MSKAKLDKGKPESMMVETIDVGKAQAKLLAGERQPQKWRKRPKVGRDSATSGSQRHTKSGRQMKRKRPAELMFQVEEKAGFIEYDVEDDMDTRLSQTAIAEAVDVTSATKFFDLTLSDFGPYCLNYTRNGRFMLLGGSRGHVAAFDWQTKKLLCEFNAMETVNSAKWLHQETLFAVAQRTGVYVYDNQGIEVHALQNLDCVLRIEFLPYHMLLATSNEKGFLGYTDVSMGTRVASICTGLGRLDTMTQNPANAIIHMGHAPGTVTLWAPTHKGPLMKMLCHKAPVKCIAVDSSGNYMATGGVDKQIKVFDLRSKGLLSSTRVATGLSSLAFSQRGLLAASQGGKVQVYKDVRQKASSLSPYLSHLCDGAVRQLQFCPFEDVLGAGHAKGFTSMLVPGSGEPNIDAMEINPLATKKQRQNAEVKLLLDKLQPEMIGLTNWVSDMASKKRPEPSKMSKPKMGKKEKEEVHREIRREQQKKTKGKTALKQKAASDSSDPLSRFRKN